MKDEYYLPGSGYRFYGCKLSRRLLIDAIRHYGFTECGEMLSFLENVCDVYPDRCALIWLREKTGECLNAHDNGSSYFTGLRMMKGELEYALRIRKGSRKSYRGLY